MEGTLLFETERLVHRVGRGEDLDALCAIMCDPEVMRTVGDGKPVPVDQVGARLRGDIYHFSKFGAAHGMIVCKENMEIIGYGGVGRYDKEEPETLELGYQFAKANWGKGIGSEFVKGALDFGFGKLNAKSIHACAMPQNKASIRVMEKAGMFFEAYYPETDRNVYLIDRGQFLAPRVLG